VVRLELQHSPTDPVANFILGQILLNNSQLEEAESYFRAAPKANPRYEKHCSAGKSGDRPESP
jgi:uncharacterized protein HemY